MTSYLGRLRTRTNKLIFHLLNFGNVVVKTNFVNVIYEKEKIQKDKYRTHSSENFQKLLFQFQLFSISDFVLIVSELWFRKQKQSNLLDIQNMQITFSVSDYLYFQIIHDVF